jgi:two-component system, NarL family, nitrate/nitrite response regulator NarL
MAVGEPITVTVIDDHPAILAGVEYWYATAEPPIRVLASGSSPKAAWIPPGDSARVVVFDLQLSSQGSASYGELRRLVDAGRQVIVYTMRDDEQAALTCLDIGAFTFLTKAEGKEHLVSATVAAAENRPYTPPALAGAFGANRRSDRPRLSEREENVLVEWFQCESKELVAEKLGITARTVNTYLDRVRIKYANVGRRARTKAALVARAIQDGLVEVDDL